jgi:hypothetical protein
LRPDGIPGGREDRFELPLQATERPEMPLADGVGVPAQVLVLALVLMRQVQRGDLLARQPADHVGRGVP